MPKKNPTGEMPFLDHLEELRWRVLWGLLALAVGTVVGFFLVQSLDVLALLKQPIAPYLPTGKLHVLRPADAFIITLKLALVVGAVLAAPVILMQIWAFVAPALYEHEKRYVVPAGLAAMGLFLVGAVMAYLWVLPAVLRILFSFQHHDLEFMITADAYIGFAAQMIVAFGLLFELPLVMVILSALGLISPDAFARQRPLALIIGAVVAAVLTPPDALSMLLMLGPILVLYEAGILLGRLVRRRGRTPGHSIGTAALVLLLAGWPAGGARAQEDARARRDTLGARADSAVQPLDTAAARRLGLPAQPSRAFPAADSAMQALLKRSGYTILRYAADTITLFGDTKEIVLDGSALVEREGTTLEADSINFLDSECRLNAEGGPVLFDGGTVLVGEGMHYDTCARRGRVARALTSFHQSGVTWYLRGGGLGIDSASVRVYGASTNLTSCDLPEPHYHFAASRVKWVTNTIMVARPATLYVRDVPVLWLPFIFQDMRQGRRSGLLVPRFGFNDLIRPNTRYRRHVSNIGYYFVLSEYTDVQMSVDWFAGNYVGINGQFRYRWLDRFVTGGVRVSRIYEEGEDTLPGARSLLLQWNHRQEFNQRTRLTADLDYATNARVVQRNTVDPFVQTATLRSAATFSKTYSWGSLSLGGSRSQDLSNGSVNQTLPTLTVSPAPIDLAEWATWSPSVSLTNSFALNQGPGVPIERAPMGGVPVFDTLFRDSRATNLSFNTPLRLGRWNWANSFRVNDTRSDLIPPAAVRFPDPLSPGDSVTRYYGENFQTDIDWSTGINLPIVSAGRWNLQPSVGIRNSTSGSFLVRNRFTGGQFVSQGKRIDFAAGISPTLFGFFPGVGPLSRVRHAVSPRVTWNYAPPADVPEAYARAINPGGAPALRSPTIHNISFGLSQTFEGKLSPPPGDTTGPETARKIKLLSIQTSNLTYDFEQDKQEGRTGWQTQTINNTLTTDLLPGFSLSMTHDLWDGPVGFDTTRFDPFLTSISARFNVTAQTFRSLASMLAGGAPAPRQEPGDTSEVDPQQALAAPGTPLGRRAGLDPTLAQFGDSPRPRAREFSASVSYDERRFRTAPPASGNGAGGGDPPDRNVGLSVRFSPTPNWAVSWSTSYNFTAGQFGQHVLRMDRDLHRWRASFAFLKAPNGNFAFNFFISLTDQPDIKFQYDQRTVKR